MPGVSAVCTSKCDCNEDADRPCHAGGVHDVARVFADGAPRGVHGASGQRVDVGQHLLRLRGVGRDTHERIPRRGMALLRGGLRDTVHIVPRGRGGVHAGESEARGIFYATHALSLSLSRAHTHTHGRLFGVLELRRDRFFLFFFLLLRHKRAFDKRVSEIEYCET